MKKSPSVVVGISTFNRADVLPQSIQSALDQRYRPLRVAVTDDASTDGTSDLAPQFPHVSWTSFPQNRGYVVARNKMMLEAPEDYYVSLDDDAWFLEGDEIALAVEYLEANPTVAAVAYDILSPDRPQQQPRGQRRFVASFIGCGHVLRLSAVRDAVGYTRFPGGYGVEEQDLCLRLLDSGHHIVEMRGVHVWHDKSMVARDEGRQYRSLLCNDLSLTVMRFPTRLLPLALAWKLVSHMAFAVRRGLVGAYFGGLRDMAKAWAGAWAARRPVRSASIARYRALARSPEPAV